MAKTDIWMPIVIGDFFKDTMHLDYEEQGFYLLVLVHLWNNQGYMSKDKLRKTLKLSPKKFDKKMSKIIDFFSCFSGEFYQKRLVFEYDKSQVNRQKRTESAIIDHGLHSNYTAYVESYDKWGDANALPRYHGRVLAVLLSTGSS